MVSENNEEDISVIEEGVLILVLVEDGLGVCHKSTPGIYVLSVLILVLVEDGLGVPYNLLQ